MFSKGESAVSQNKERTKKKTCSLFSSEVDGIKPRLLLLLLSTR